MTEKVFLWGFPGLGKSSLSSNGLHIVDADCQRFKYHFSGSAPSTLHQREEWQGVSLDPVYPQNYLDFVNSVDADIVLLNCHISLLKSFDKEKLLLVFPSSELKAEYLLRYHKRGDNLSFVDYMEENFDDMVRAVECSPYRKYEVTKPRVYLQDLLDGGELMAQFITKQELTKLFDECIKYGVYTPQGDFAGKTGEELSQMLFEGKIEANIELMKKNLSSVKAQIEQEQLDKERRGGLTRNELADKIMQGIVNGALGIRYAQIAPYSHGYEVTFGGDDKPGSTRSFTNRWECYGGDLFSVPYRIADSIAAGRQNDLVFGNKCDSLDIHKMLKSIEDMEAKRITCFTPEAETDFQRAKNSYTYPYRSSVATVMDVHAGKGLDGIVQHHYHGDYSTMTPTMQNSLVESLVCLKGFCLDCLSTLDVSMDDIAGIIKYLKRHGTDISSPEKLSDWIKGNPEKCALPENRCRKVSLDAQIKGASSKTPETQFGQNTKDISAFEH